MVTHDGDTPAGRMGPADPLRQLLAVLPPEQRDAAAAAVISYRRAPGDDAGAAQAVAAAMRWSGQTAAAFIAQHGEPLRAAAAAWLDGARAAGVDPGEYAGLQARKADPTAEVTNRMAAFFQDIAARLPAGKTVGDVFSAADLEALVQKHGLTIGPDGQPALAEGAADTARDS